ncbi:hypothetical protein OESDEN_14758 [Oesophagostomum dentatum]|uniref:glucuronosyltransferase n=1 Tax=Oesophagostomum dentatum TaxID=61180 RepID=A0A0B1SQM8_OESDE|nr:hypothetical protein OESDEN_14758 [Oesophagostomum dentatum]
MHGGINGLVEALRRAVPLVVIPIFADQFRNGRNVEKRGIGKVELTLLSLLLHSKFEALKSFLLRYSQKCSPLLRYKKNAVRMAKLMKEKPFSPEERLVEWTTFAVENGVLDVLHVEGSRMNSIVYFNLDVIAVFIIFICLSVTIVVVLFKKLIRSFTVIKLKQS